MSRKMLEYLDVATSESDREHVTLMARQDCPIWVKHGTIVNSLDLSDIKLSVDTPQDLERVRIAYKHAETAYTTAIRIFGHNQVHRV